MKKDFNHSFSQNMTYNNQKSILSLKQFIFIALYLLQDKHSHVHSHELQGTIENQQIKTLYRIIKGNKFFLSEARKDLQEIISLILSVLKSIEILQGTVLHVNFFDPCM